MKCGYIELTGLDGNPCFFRVDQIQTVRGGKFGGGGGTELWLSGDRNTLVQEPPEAVTEKIGKAMQAADSECSDKVDLAKLRVYGFCARRFSEVFDKFVGDVVPKLGSCDAYEDVMNLASVVRKTLLNEFKP